MPHYKLTYYDARGNAECIRLIFAMAKPNYEDHRVTHEHWTCIKEKTPLGRVPVLEVDGKQLAQCQAICRYLAKQFGLHGSDPFEEAIIDSIADQAKDLQNVTTPYLMLLFKRTEGDLEKLKTEKFHPTVKKNYEYFDKILKENGTGYLVGSKLTWVDLLIAESTSYLSEYTDNIENQYPELKAHMEKITSIPEIKHWIENRPKTPY